MIRVTAGKPMPPIGFSAPPQSAGHHVTIGVCMTIVAAIITVILNGLVIQAIANMTPKPAPVVQLNGKDQTRCCDANGNAFAAR